MDLSEFTLKIIFLFVPGLISFLMIDALTIHKELKLYQLLVGSLILGFANYLLYYVGGHALKVCLEVDFDFFFLQALANKAADLDHREIACVTGLAVPVGFVVSYAINHKMLHRLAHMLRISKKFGDVDVWSYIMNSRVPAWVVIRDVQHDLMYEGWIHAFSDSTGKDEVFLRDVKVFSNSTAEKLYEVPGMYLPRRREALTVEFPMLEFTDLIERPERKKVGENG